MQYVNKEMFLHEYNITSVVLLCLVEVTGKIFGLHTNPNLCESKDTLFLLVVCGIKLAPHKFKLTVRITDE